MHIHNLILSGILILMPIATTIQASPLTRGNIFAEGLAGCTVGVAVKFLSSLWLATQTPGMIAVAPINRVGVVRYCFTGALIAVTIDGAIELSDLYQEFYDPHAVIDNKIRMIYPRTPNKDY